MVVIIAHIFIVIITVIVIIIVIVNVIEGSTIFFYFELVSLLYCTQLHLHPPQPMRSPSPQKQAANRWNHWVPPEDLPWQKNIWPITGQNYCHVIPDWLQCQFFCYKWPVFTKMGSPFTSFLLSSGFNLIAKHFQPITEHNSCHVTIAVKQIVKC